MRRGNRFIGRWMVVAVACAFALIAAGCAAFAPIAPPLHQADADRLSARGQAVTLSELQDGRSLYVGRCAGCHRLPRPDAYLPDRWAGFVDEMSARAKLTAPEARAVLHYVLAARDAVPVN